LLDCKGIPQSWRIDQKILVEGEKEMPEIPKKTTHKLIAVYQVIFKR
jgi:hypothetical protein